MSKCTYSNTQFRGSFVVSKNKLRCIYNNPLSGAHFRQLHADLALILDRWPSTNAPQWQSIFNSSGLKNTPHCLVTPRRREEKRREDWGVKASWVSRSAMASSSSSTTGVNKKRVKLIKPSRENHYEGEPIMCNHMVVAPRWTSWSDDNPGRRFYGCPYYNDQVSNLCL